MARKRSISWSDIADSKVGKANSHKVTELWPVKGQPKKSKYGNVKTVVDGVKFDSLGESRRYSFLKRMERTGRIKDLRLQVPYELTPKIPKTATEKAVQAMIYKADFVYINVSTGLKVIEDFKGRRTSDYLLKRKLMRVNKNIEIYETNTETLKANEL